MSLAGGPVPGCVEGLAWLRVSTERKENEIGSAGVGGTTVRPDVLPTPCPARPCSPDVDGRTPLHWAAYKGHANTLRLLLVLDGGLGLGDREGCTPLHWAAIRGNSEACTVLLQVRPGAPGACSDGHRIVPVD